MTSEDEILQDEIRDLFLQLVGLYCMEPEKLEIEVDDGFKVTVKPGDRDYAKVYGSQGQNLSALMAIGEAIGEALNGKLSRRKHLRVILPQKEYNTKTKGPPPLDELKQDPKWHPVKLQKVLKKLLVTVGMRHIEVLFKVDPENREFYQCAVCCNPLNEKEKRFSWALGKILCAIGPVHGRAMYVEPSLCKKAKRG